MKRILLIDDDESIRGIGKQALEKEGYFVTEASDGIIAMKHFQEKPFDLVITDMIMPQGEGMETIFALKNLFDVKIIAISIKQEFLEMASPLVAATITKPYETVNLLKIVKEVLEM